MTGLSGADLITIVQQSGNQLPIILISSYGANISHNNVFGNFAVFQKSFEYMALVSKAKLMITQRRERKASVVSELKGMGKWEECYNTKAPGL